IDPDGERACGEGRRRHEDRGRETPTDPRTDTETTALGHLNDPPGCAHTRSTGPEHGSKLQTDTSRVPSFRMISLPVALRFDRGEPPEERWALFFDGRLD